MADEQFNPADYTVDGVNEYLDSADDAETARVLEAERSGEARKGVLNGPHGTPEDEADSESTEVSRGLEKPYDGLPEGVEPVMSLQEAASLAVTQDTDATAHTLEDAAELGYFGTSVGALYTGRSDDGLSQAALGIGSDGGGQVVKPVQEAAMPDGTYDRSGAFVPAPPSEGGTKDGASPVKDED